MQITHSVIIRRPLPEVEAWLSDIANDRLWQEDVVESGVTSSGPIRVGTEGYEVRRLFGFSLRSTWVITDLEPGRSYSFKSTEAFVPYAGSVIFEPADTGTGTRLTYAFSLHPEGVVALFEPLMEPLVTNRFRADLEHLVKILENRT